MHFFIHSVTSGLFISEVTFFLGISYYFRKNIYTIQSTISDFKFIFFFFSVFIVCCIKTYIFTSMANK